MISVLYVDDEPSLLDLGRIFLEGLGDFEVGTATSAKAGLDLLKAGRYDAVISDYLMPDMDGIGFLKKVRSGHGDVPFILFTGKGREEVVIDAINNGADFYLQKGGNPKAQFAELAHKIRQAVNHHRTEQELRMKTEEIDRFFSLSLDLLSIGDTEGRILHVNSAWEDVLGYSVDELEGRSYFDLVHPDDKERTMAASRELVNGNKITEFLNRFRAKDGSYRWIEWRSVPYEGRLVYSAARDITERKMSEEELKVAYQQITANEMVLRSQFEEVRSSKAVLETANRTLEEQREALRRQLEEIAETQRELKENEENFRSIVENSPEAVFLGTRDFRFAYLNPACVRMLGAASVEQLLGTCFLDRIHPSLHAIIRERVHDLTVDKKPVEPLDEVYIRMDGTLIDVEVNAVPLSGLGDIEMMVVVRDVSQQKRANEALQRSEQMLKIVLDTFPGVVYWKDRDSVYLGANRESAIKAGFADPSEFVGKTDYDMPWARTEAEAYRADDRQVMDSGTPKLHVTESQLRADGKIGWLDTSKVPLRDSDGNVIGILGTSTDITSVKMAEQKLLESEARNRRLLEQSFDAVIVHRDGRILQVNEAAIKLLGASGAQDLIGRPVHDIIEPGIEEVVQKRIKLLSENPGAIVPPIEERLRRLDGSPIEAEVMATSYLEDGRPNIQTVFRDITERNRIHRELKQSEEQFRMLVENIPDAVFFQANDRITYMNPAAVSLFGAASADQMLGTDAVAQIDPRFHYIVRERIRQLTVERKPVGKLDEIYLKLDGTPVDVETAAVPFRYNNEDGCLLIVRDITGRKQAEEMLLAINQELKDGEEKFHELFELGGEAIMLVDTKDGSILECNTAMSEMFGYSHAELLRMRNLDISAEPELTRKAMSESRPGNALIPLRYYRRRDGTVFPVEINARFFTLKGREVHVAAIRDITERKRAEDALHEIYRKLSLLNSITRHDILNKITILQMNLALAREKSSDGTMGEFIERLDRAVLGIRDHIEFSRIYQDLGLQEPMWQPLQDILATLEVPPGIKLESRVGGVEVYADPMLAKVFYNLMDNSVRHGVKCTWVRASFAEGDDGMTIAWEDDGIGIPASEKELIFEHGYGKNTGLGLFISREILAITRITIMETGAEGNGARFEILVPKGAYRIRAG